MPYGDDGSVVAEQYSSQDNFAKSPPLDLGRVALRPIRPQDHEWLYELETHPHLIHRWRLGGRTPSPEQFQRLLWDGIVCQYLVIEKASNSRTGLVMFYQTDAPNGTGHLAMVSHPSYFRSSFAIDGIILFIDYIFTCFNVRKLYGESMGFNFGQFTRPDNPRFGVENLFVVEGVLRDHFFYNGRYWDKVVTAIYRDYWLENRQVLIDEVARWGHPEVQ
jgi:RimJ/RimL family protein N-acetyltransferase